MKKYSIFICIICIAFAAAALTACFNYSSFDGFIKIDNDRVGIGEYKMYLYEQKKRFEETGGEDIWETDFDGVPAEDMAKQHALNSLVMVKTAIKHTDELNIELSDEDLKSIETKSRDFLNEFKNSSFDTSDIKEDDVREVIKEGIIQQKVFDFITKGFEMSEADFQAYFDNYYESNKRQLNQVTVDYIFIAEGEGSKDTAYKAYSDIIGGGSFESVKSKYSDKSYDEVDVTEGMFEKEAEDVIYSLSNGDISPVVQTSAGYYIFKATNVVLPNMDELMEKVKETYIKEKKNEIYQKQNDKWSANVVVEKDEEQWNSIHIN